MELALTGSTKASLMVMALLGIGAEAGGGGNSLHSEGATGKARLRPGQPESDGAGAVRAQRKYRGA